MVVAEAMATGCLVIGSDTAPVREIIDSTNGILVPFFDIDQLADASIEALSRPRRFERHRERARELIMDRYDLKRICLPQLLDFLEIELSGKAPAEDNPALAESEAN
jgi:glycosyltransferase involved in cell wall biosynthesis